MMDLLSNKEILGIIGLTIGVFGIWLLTSGNFEKLVK